eukprot:107863-Amphidinium_carterae.1
MAEAEYFLPTEEDEHVHLAHVTYGDIVQDTEPWRQLLNYASEVLGSRTLWEPSTESDFFKQVADLCPGWRI